jgi:peroxiredoxin Q/BCP
MALKVGDIAPEIKSKDQNGNEITLSQFRGKKVALYFYPKDDTPGCTAEACNLRDNYSELKSKGYEILGVSVDSEKSHKKFIEKYSLPFSLIADTEKKVVEDYGVWVEKSMYGKKYFGTARVTFLIDENGVITKIIDKVDTKNHTAQILAE